MGAILALVKSLAIHLFLFISISFYFNESLEKSFIYLALFVFLGYSVLRLSGMFLITDRGVNNGNNKV